eukprot:TRINITY_DN11859_c0_g1_i1.p4 TRINITY_DN11859_c0_g1~~TRINITY_DN11859_c0_g1_i1.p4  ORF type:complete len:101 (-),score=0.64 TRINITY_DN11859_c0_g1_i1:411-713(-)
MSNFFYLCFFGFNLRVNFAILINYDNLRSKNNICVNYKKSRSPKSRKSTNEQENNSILELQQNFKFQNIYQKNMQYVRIVLQQKYALFLKIQISQQQQYF